MHVLPRAYIPIGRKWIARVRCDLEHIINDAKIITRENIALCCASFNSSKGTKKLSVWLGSCYCKRRGISTDTVADVVKHALRSGLTE